MNPQLEAPTLQSGVQWQPQGMQPQPQAPSFQPSTSRRPICSEADLLIRLWASKCCAEQHYVRGASDITMNPSNTFVLVASVFALLYCVYTLAIFALMLALVARVFHRDPANAASAVVLYLCGFYFALASIGIGLAFYILLVIIYILRVDPSTSLGIFNNTKQNVDTISSNKYAYKNKNLLQTLQNFTIQRTSNLFLRN